MKKSPLVPIDRTAARVVSRGVHFEPHIPEKDTHDTRKARPEVWPGTHGTNFSLTGLKVGWFTVMGLSVEYPKRWVVRCVCGNYEFRSAKALKNGKMGDKKCRPCQRVEYIAHNKGVDIEQFVKGKMSLKGGGG